LNNEASTRTRVAFASFSLPSDEKNIWSHHCDPGGCRG
jgi:hypothetical protein